jgi:hypothetical protein
MCFKYIKMHNKWFDEKMAITPRWWSVKSVTRTRTRTGNWRKCPEPEIFYWCSCICIASACTVVVVESCDGFSYYYRFSDIAINSVNPSFIWQTEMINWHRTYIKIILTIKLQSVAILTSEFYFSGDFENSLIWF